METRREIESLRKAPIDVRELFKRTLVKSTEGPAFKANTNNFFDIWFKDYGSAFLFLFKKNLHVTNMQFAELLALLQSMAIDDSEQGIELQFLSPKEFTSNLSNLLSCFPISAKEEAEQTYSLIADLYSDLLRRIVVLSPHFGTCEVFLPANISINLALLCGYSGYIHSCGSNVYVRNTIKASYASLHKALQAYLLRNKNSSAKSKVRLFVYSHEDTSQLDREGGRLGDLIHGLEDCKIHLEKTYLGERRLVSAIRTLKEDQELAKHFIIPESFGRGVEAGLDIDPLRSLFMIRDFSLGRHLGTRGEDVYLILYEQLYKNCNQFHYFDENKPAWITHTTTPHTLIGAMLNVTKPGWPKQPIICDPFVGTGTSLFELAKYTEAKSIGRDISPLAHIVIGDNKIIFSSSVEKLGTAAQFLRSGLDKREEFPLRVKTRTDFLEVQVKIKAAFFELFTKEGVVTVDLDDEEMSNEAALAKTLKNAEEYERWIFYLMLKTLRRNEGALHRGTLDTEWTRRFRSEMERVEREIRDLLRIYSKASEKVEHSNIIIFQDDFSFSCAIDPSAFLSDTLFIEDGSVELLKEEQYDVIIADPPYGFNTQSSVERLAKLYNSMIPKMVRALRDGGQLVITLPERSYIGRRSPFFTHKELVTQKILCAAQAVDLEVVKSAVPEPTALFKPPYYWRSERALARSILHFRFRRAL